MPRPKGPVNFAGRVRAYEAFAAGLKKAEIAREMGVTKATITDWSHKDHWEERLNSAVDSATDAVNHVLGNEIAQTLATMRQRLMRRVAELESLCQSPNDNIKLKAITAWLQLAGIKQILPNPLDTKGARTLELISDIGGKALESTTPKTLGEAPGELEGLPDERGGGLSRIPIRPGG